MALPYVFYYVYLLIFFIIQNHIEDFVEWYDFVAPGIVIVFFLGGTIALAVLVIKGAVSERRRGGYKRETLSMKEISDLLNLYVFATSPIPISLVIAYHFKQNDSMFYVLAAFGSLLTAMGIWRALVWYRKRKQIWKMIEEYYHERNGTEA